MDAIRESLIHKHLLEVPASHKEFEKELELSFEYLAERQPLINTYLLAHTYALFALRGPGEDVLFLAVQTFVHAIANLVRAFEEEVELRELERMVR